MQKFLCPQNVRKGHYLRNRKLTLELLQEADVILIEQPQVINVIPAHDHALQTHSQSKAAVFLRVDAAVAQHLGMYHAAAQNFNPALAFTQAAAFAMAVEALYVNLCGRLGEGEMMGTETYHTVLAIQTLDKGFQCALQIGKRNSLIDHKALNLME